MNKSKEISYAQAIKDAFDFLLDNFPEVFIIGQGVWSPWYVGNTMNDLEKKFGKDRVIDTPTSESAVTGIAVGASLCNKKPIVVHPRIDFSLYAMDAIINQAAKWSSMFGAQAAPSFTARLIINRGGEQGAQHSQSLQSWFAHIPGLRVVMPSSVSDARDILISSVLSPDPVIYIDDRWLYETTDFVEPIKIKPLSDFKPEKKLEGESITIVSSSYLTYLSLKAAKELEKYNISVEVIDLKTLTNINYNVITKSVKKTKRVLCIDGGWSSCGVSAEVITSILEKINPNILLHPPQRITLPAAPAPSSKKLENNYYISIENIIEKCREIMSNSL